MKLTFNERTPVIRPWSVRAHRVIQSPDELLTMRPAFRRSLCDELDVATLNGRICPVTFEDGSAGIFVLSDYCHDDQTLALLELLQNRGFRLNEPSLFVLTPALMVSIDRMLTSTQRDGSGSQRASVSEDSAHSSAFNDMVAWGLAHGASDIHLNVQRTRVQSSVYFTIAGRYVCPERYRQIPTATLLEMLSVAWMGVQGGNGAVFDPMIEQQGRLGLWLDDRYVMLRWASLATDAGPSVCLRVLVTDQDSLTPNLHALGYLNSQVQALHRARSQAGGAVILAGVVGSGKSTTIATLMREIPSDRKVITLEDPAEYLIPNALQNTICRTLDENDGESFDTKLKTIKRSAMNDLLIGEIRDTAGGRAFMDLAGCGVNLYTTVHAGSALLISDRLASSFIGVARDLLSTPGILKLLVYQCLIARLCVHCAQDVRQVIHLGRWICANGIARDITWFKQWLQTIETHLGVSAECFRFRNETGCQQCQSSPVSSLNGTHGRTVVEEMIEPVAEPDFLDGLKRQDGLWLYDWFHSRACTPLADSDMTGKTAMQVAVYKMSQGLVDPRQVESRFGIFQSVMYRNHPRV